MVYWVFCWFVGVLVCGLFTRGIEAKQFLTPPTHDCAVRCFEKLRKHCSQVWCPRPKEPERTEKEEQINLRGVQSVVISV